MGVRYRALVYSYNGTAYRIDIQDSAYSSTVNTFEAGNGFGIAYKGITERCDPIMASTCNVPFVVQNTTHEAFIDEIMQAQEERFTVQVYKNGTLEWSGILLADQVQREDRYYPYEVNLTFIDGLARLKDLDYNNNGLAYTGRDTLIAHIIKCLSKTGIMGLYGSTDYFLDTCVHYYEYHHTYAVNKCPLAYTDLNHSIFYEYDENGKVTYQSAGEALEAILRKFNARIFMTGGYFHIMQAQNYSINNTYFRKFDKSGTLQTSGSRLTRMTPSNSNRKAGGIHKYMPPLREVKLTYKLKITNSVDNNFLPIQSKYETTVNFLNAVYISQIQGVATLFVTGVLHEWYQINNPIVTPSSIFTRWRVKIIKTRISDGYKEYLTGSNQNSNPSVTQWTTNSAAYYDVFGSIKNGYSWHTWNQFSFQTPGFQDDCTFEFQCTVLGHFNANIQPYTIGAYETWDYECQDFEVTSSYDFSDDEDKEVEYKATNILTGGAPVASTLKLELPDTLIGDGPDVYHLGKLRVSPNGSSWYDSALWAVHNSTIRVKLNQLVVNEILKGQRVPVEKYQGGWIDNAITPFFALAWGYKVFIPSMIDIDCEKDEVNGEWFNIISPA